MVETNTAEKKADDTATKGSDDQADASAPTEPKRLPGRTLVLFIVLPVVLMLAAAGGGAWYWRDDWLPAEAKSAEEQQQAAVFYDLPEMLVNLNTKGRQASYLKLRVALEVDDPRVLPKLERLLPRIVDNFQVYLRELRADDLSGSAGLYRLKEELLLRVNTAIEPTRVKDVLFKEMLVQ